MPRDWSIPLSDAEVEELKVIFRSMQTYNSDGYIDVKELPSFCAAIGFDRTTGQSATYKDHFDKLFGGTVPLKVVVDAFSRLHSSSKIADLVAGHYDTDGDGYISEEEYQHVVNLIVSHDPAVADIDFATFLEQADANKDGKVDIVECANWMKACLPS